ncbi:MAG TPA: hypothetical protein VH458_10625 [Vicinamibacterales bacterium]|jgi:hypothetical protein
MKFRSLALPAWVKDEQLLLRYLMSPHAGHSYTEDVLDAICLITSWVLIAVSILTVMGVVVDAVLR